MRGREGEKLPSITSVHGKNEERKDCEKERGREGDPCLSSSAKD